MISQGKTVGALMTRKVVTIAENDTLAKLQEGMSKFRFRHLPVVRGTKLVGLVSHRDLLHALTSSLSAHADVENAAILARAARQIMQTEVVTIRPDESLASAARLMWEAKLGCLPVTDSDENLLGILTEADFLRFALETLEGGLRPPAPGLLATR